MKIVNLRISNFRGIREVDLQNLGSMVVIAGQNGCGKSCVFDSIRLLKSVYGGYQQNEWQQWMGEFQIQLSNRSSDFSAMFNDLSKELRISCTFTLAEAERKYIFDNSNDLLREVIWRSILPEAYEWGRYRMAMFAAQFRQREPEVQKRVSELLPALNRELVGNTVEGECFIPVGGVPNVAPSTILPVVFSTFRPSHIGVIDYHGAQRHYAREYVQGVNLNFDANVQQRSQTTLYNPAAKYSNVKSELASSYLREILAETAGASPEQKQTLIATLQELFHTFFPDKKFLGPKATRDGALTFPVVTGPSTHDLDELSAGEKEILYGYLRIRNSAPRHSIILIDEPELHLNPRLIRGLPQFYRQHLGQALGNQIWLVSHSDALLREVVGKSGYDIFHMLPCNTLPANEKQMRPLRASVDLEMAIVDLVGDLATYHPNGKVVIFEGGGDSEFDRKIVAWLFPDLARNANLISGANKTRVRALHEILERAAEKGQLPFKFFSVTDRDSEALEKTTDSIRRFSWDVYHIENYFMSAEHISHVLASLSINNPPSPAEVLDELRKCARETLPSLLRHELSSFANEAMVKSISTRTDARRDEIVDDLIEAIRRSADRLNALIRADLNADALARRESELKAKFERSLADGTWQAEFRGRDVLKRFVARWAPASVSYEVFRNLIASDMKDSGYQPAGMKAVVDKILAAS